MATEGSCSLEFFPPKTIAGREKLLNETLPALADLNPEYCSITYGAGGSTRDTTVATVAAIADAGQDVAPHLSFGTDNRETLKGLLEGYQQQGVQRLVALRGDAPGGDGTPEKSCVYANELVSFIRETTGDHFNIKVAAYPEIHPEAVSYSHDIHFLKAKLDAGANAAVTQYFFNVESYFYFMDRCAAAGITQPIHPGIMPITNFANLMRFSTACGAEVPRWIRQRMADFAEDPDSAYKFGIEVVSQLCSTLIDSGAPPIHFYTMNQAEPMRTIARNIGLLKGGDNDAGDQTLQRSVA
ncbi:methylenetetrahydrofolate reductase [NAD(P)H] [Luminiphilus sp. nBUS_07]|uniref:methylenetetrahydrofolate reductase [NAD(P)H] n=1 Tax=Luminiphilus sp. nBUS_07 TaxID=3395314 RepID=UPI003EB7DDB0